MLENQYCPQWQNLWNRLNTSAVKAGVLDAFGTFITKLSTSSQKTTHKMKQDDSKLRELLDRGQQSCYLHGILGSGMAFVLSFIVLKSTKQSHKFKVLPTSLSIGLLTGVMVAHYSLTMLRDRILMKQRWQAYLKGEERR